MEGEAEKDKFNIHYLKITTMNTLQAQQDLQHELVKKTGATKVYKPFEWGVSIIPAQGNKELTLRGHLIAYIEVWTDTSWYMDYAMNVIADNTDLTSEEIAQVYTIINDRKQ